MEIILAIVIAFVCGALPTIVAAITGVLCLAAYSSLGLILGFESITIGIGGTLGALANYWISSTYLKKNGSMSHAPATGRLASVLYILFFIAGLICSQSFDIEPTGENYVIGVIAVSIAAIFFGITSKKNRKESLARFSGAVSEYKIVKKYDDRLPWAIHLTLEDGNERWNETIPGSFCARNPESDLTFVFSSEEDALRHAQDTFPNATRRK
jgi:hypothetical protein